MLTYFKGYDGQGYLEDNMIMRKGKGRWEEGKVGGDGWEGEGIEKGKGSKGQTGRVMQGNLLG